MKNITIISYQVLFSKSKSSTIIFAELLKKKGYNVRFLTLNISFISYLRRDFRLKRIKELNLPLNKPFEYNGITSMIRFNFLHIFNFRNSFLNNLSTQFFKRISFKDKKIIDFCNKSDAIIFESSCNTIFPLLKKNINAQFIYKANDDLVFVKTHPYFSYLEKRDYMFYDFISVVDPDMLEKFPNHNNTFVTPHGVSIPNINFVNPFTTEKNLIFVGHTGLDNKVIKGISKLFPDVTIHLIGRVNVDAPNIICYGEMPYKEIFQYIYFADICLATYNASPDSIYYKNSIKIKIYKKMNKKILLPIVMNKNFNYPNSFFYDDNLSSIKSAVNNAMEKDIIEFNDNTILSWNESLEMFLNETILRA